MACGWMVACEYDMPAQAVVHVIDTFHTHMQQSCMDEGLQLWNGS